MTQDLATRVQQTLRDVPDFPKPGILFKDITPVLEDGPLFADITAYFAAHLRDKGVDKIMCMESRGFIFGAPVANALGVGLVVVRKPGKLPSDTIGVDYELEYGTDRLEIHTDSLSPGERVVIVDDLLATGGTCSATVQLAEQAGAEVLECLFLIDLAFLGGAARFDAPHHALLTY